jgi:predicted amidohydrolase YtcJ
MVTHISSHFSMVNSKALEMQGITKDTRNTEDSLISREAGSMEPNGVLQELAAIPLMILAISPAKQETALKFLNAGQDMPLCYGYTTA